MRLTLNAGIGDLILSRAMLTGPAEVALDYQAIDHYRTPTYRPFAETLLQTLFQAPQFQIVESDEPGMTPQAIAGLGFQPAVPDLRGVIGDEWRPETHYTVVTTKVRGWPRDRYQAIRSAFLARLEQLGRIVLLGERTIGRNAEYAEHGDDKVYSIYEDLKPLASVNATVEELGSTPPQWDDFVADCSMMAHADRVITLGSGGNVSMAMAFADKCLLHIGGTEMERLFAAMPPSDRVRMARSDAEYLEAML